MSSTLITAVGGGGGWACDGHQGFVSGVVKSDGSVGEFEFHMAEDTVCCMPNPRPPPKSGHAKG